MARQVGAMTHRAAAGFIAVLLILTSWADTGFPYNLVKGFPAVGFAPPYGIFPQQPANASHCPKH